MRMPLQVLLLVTILPMAGAAQTLPDPIVFVSRAIPDDGSNYIQGGENAMPGVGPHSRLRTAGPGQLLVLEPGGSVRTLLDGNAPDSVYGLMDFNAPSVSWDGTQIVFAAIPEGTYDQRPNRNPNAWRIYTMSTNGSGLQQLTSTPANLTLDSGQTFNGADDTDPVWLPDGRIVFSSTRFPGFATYSGVRQTNLYVMNADGSDLHRITAEKNGADRPVIDPLTGKVVFARWWRNHWCPTDDLSTVADPAGGFVRRDGVQAGGGASPLRNCAPQVWEMAEINPDGTGLRAFTKFHRHDVLNHAYGGAFTDDGRFYANFFPMANMTEAAGFGGIRRYNVRGMGNGVQNAIVTQIVGIGQGDLFNYLFNNPTSFGVFVPVDGYAGEPGFLSDGRLVYSWAPDIAQDYGLFVANQEGSGRTAVYDVPGRSELRASPIRARTPPPVIPDSVSTIASPTPPAENGPYAIDGTYTFDARNVYFNAPVDTNVLDAPPVGSAATIGFFAAHQRSNPGSFENLDFPILVDQLPVNPDGSVVNLASPANMQLFEQIRDAAGRIVQTASFRRANEGATHVAGMNFGRPGEIQSCVGCHAGHSMIPIPADPQWTNLATGTTVSADGTNGSHLIDRRALTDPAPWSGNEATLTFPVPVTARSLRLYGSGQVDVELLRAGAVVGTVSSSGLQASGTDVPFATVVIDAFTLSLTGGTVTEVEMIASGDASCPSCGGVNAAPAVTITAPVSGTTASDGALVAFAGAAQDAEDGDLSPGLTWTSDRDGVIGTGAAFSRALSTGTHSITASVTDAGGLSGEDVITVIVQSNTSPNVTVTSPVDGSVVSAGTAVTFTGTAQDTEDGDLSTQLQWTSDRDGLLGNGAAFATTLSVGTHLVTASVTDTGGLVGTAVSTLIVGDGGGSSTVTLASIGTDDGRVVEQTEDSGSGSVAQSTAADVIALRIGDYARDRQVKSILSFDTSAIPDGVPIISATLRLQRGAVRGTNPFSTHGDALVDVIRGAFGNNPVLQVGDFQAPTTAVGVATLSDPVTNGGWSEAILDPDGLAALNPTGLTQLRVYFERDDNDDGGRDYVGFHSGDDADPATHPQLIVTYGTGGGGNTPPQVAISAPTNGSSFGAGAPITFQGTADDVEDGDLSAELTWSSDRDGTIGNGPTFSAVLSAGAHVVTASVVDAGLVLGAASVTLTVDPGGSSQDTFTSVAPHDGLVVEQDENSNTGGVVQSASGTVVALRVGDLSRDRQVKTIVSFDTSAIPDGATIISATLRLQRSTLRGTNPFNTHGDALVDIKQGAFGDDPILQAVDFQASASAVGVATLSNPGATGDWSEGELGPDGLAAINRTGLTQLRVYFEIDDNDDGSRDYMAFHSGDDANPATHPQLVVVYEP